MSQQEQKKPQGARIHAQLAEIMAAVDAVGKERRNSGQGFNFRGIEDVMDALHPVFAEHKVFILSEVLDERTEERTTIKGATLIYRVLKVKVSYVSGEDGSRESVVVVGEGMDSGDKAANKAMSAALKYALTQTLILPYGQADGDADTPPESKPGKAAAQASAAPVQQDEPLRGKLVELMSADGISNIEMLRYCQRKAFLPAEASPADLSTLPAGLLSKMLAPANWAQVKGVIEATRAEVKPEPTAAAAKPLEADQTAFNSRLYNMMGLAGIKDEELTTYLRGRGLMTETQVIHNLSPKMVDAMLDGKDKTTGRNNFELIVENIKKARKS